MATNFRISLVSRFDVDCSLKIDYHKRSDPPHIRSFLKKTPEESPKNLRRLPLRLGFGPVPRKVGSVKKKKKDNLHNKV